MRNFYDDRIYYVEIEYGTDEENQILYAECDVYAYETAKSAQAVKGEDAARAYASVYARVKPGRVSDLAPRTLVGKYIRRIQPLAECESVAQSDWRE